MLCSFFARNRSASLGIFLLTLFLPASVLAGSQSYTSPGTYTFSVPAYSSLTVQVWGGGGSGSGGAVAGPSYGGGGGGYSEQTFGPGITGNVTVTVGAGGGGGWYQGGTGGGGVTWGFWCGSSICNDYGGPGNAGSGSSFGPYVSAGGGEGAEQSGSGHAGSGGYGSIEYGGYGGGGWGGGGGTAAYGGSGGSGGYTSGGGWGWWHDGQDGSAPGGGGGGGAPPTYPYGGGTGGAGAPGEISITWTAPPTCSVSISPNPSTYSYSGTPVKLSWSSSDASQVYINNVGWVGTSGSTNVASQASTDYSCYGWSSAYGSGSWNSALLTVNPPPQPSATITASSSSIQVGQSTNILATYSAGSGDALTCTDISYYANGANGLVGPCMPFNKTYQFTASSTGTVTFYAAALTDYYTSWATYAHTSVTVTNPPPTCTPSTQYICTGPGSDTITASSTSASCVQTQNSVTTCVAPQYCSAGSATCLSPTITFNASGDLTGQLQAIPSFLRPGETTQIYWNVENAQSCTVTGTDGDSWSALSSPQNGETSKPLAAQTIYTLTCQGYSGASPPSITQTVQVDMTPTYKED